MIEAIIEGLLFVVGDEGLTLEQLEEVTEFSEEDIKVALTSLRDKYSKDDRGIQIKFLGDTFKLTTKKEHREYYKKLVEAPSTNMLSQSALETLAIIAYNPKITRGQVDEIRGVYSGQMIRKLVAKGLVKESGRSDLPGRPILYEVTREFLDYFGLSTIEELPEMKDITIKGQNDEEIDLYLSKYQEKEEKEEI